MISAFMGSSPTAGFVLIALLGILSLPLSLCPRPALSLSLSLSPGKITNNDEYGESNRSNITVKLLAPEAGRRTGVGAARGSSLLGEAGPLLQENRLLYVFYI